jgi:amino acid transporter
LIAGYKVIYRTKRVRPQEADLYTGKKEIDDQEAEFLAAQAERRAEKGDRGKWYRRTLGYLF